MRLMKRGTGADNLGRRRAAAKGVDYVSFAELRNGKARLGQPKLRSNSGAVFSSTA